MPCRRGGETLAVTSTGESVNLTQEQILALAPDTVSAAAGKKLAAPKTWKNLGLSERAVWGECQGSALYQVRTDLSDLAVKCSCPSRKFPCKHGLGLLLMFAANPKTFAPGSEPEWVSDWISKRAQTAAKKEAKAEAAEKKEETPQDIKAREKRVAKKEERVLEGIEGLQLFLSDLVRNGLAGLETKGPSFWENQAARLVDAQVPGFARRLRNLAELPGSFPDWPERLLAEIGKTSLLIQAYRRQDQLDPDLRAEVRQLAGFTVGQEDVLAGPDIVRDTWTVLGLFIEDDDRLRTQRTWLTGEKSGRRALNLQFSAGPRVPFAMTFIPGTRFDAALAFYPGSYRLRALVKERYSEPSRIQQLPLAGSAGDLFDQYASALARQPWIDRFPAVLSNAMPLPAAAGAWHVATSDGNMIPLVPGAHWRMLALSGGHPAAIAGEWNGHTLLPLGMVTDGVYGVLWTQGEQSG